MFKDCCPEILDKTQIRTDSYYYILPNGIDEESAGSSALQLVKFQRFLNIDERIKYPEGIFIEGSKLIYDDNGDASEYKICGKVIYQAVGQSTSIYTKDGIKYRVSDTDNDGYLIYRFCPIQDLKGKFKMKYIFRISKTIQIALNLAGDVYFNSEEEGNRYLRALRYYGGELSADGIRVVFNKKCIHFYNYNVFIKGKLIDCPDYSKLFEMLCNAYPVKDVNSFERTFYLYSDWVEFIQI